MTKEEKIKELNRSLKYPNELPGVFLPTGRMPNYEYMLLAEMPSMNKSVNANNIVDNFTVSTRDKFLQEMLVKYGMAGSYITDIVKERDYPRRPTKEEIEKWLPFLIKEIEIIEPKCIIVLGKRTYEHSFLPFIEPKIPRQIRVSWIFHYSSQVPRAKFEKKIKEVRLFDVSSG
jgi:uracil-DNA glycosylase family 4